MTCENGIKSSCGKIIPDNNVTQPFVGMKLVIVIIVIIIIFIIIIIRIDIIV